MPERRLAKARQGYEGYVYQPPSAFRMGERHDILFGLGLLCEERCHVCEEFLRRMAERHAGAFTDRWPTGDGATS